MSRNLYSQRQANNPPATIGNSSRPATDPQWEQMVLELRACCDKPVQELDEIATARYLSSECSEVERKEIKQTVAQPVDFTECIILAETVLRDMDSVA